MTKSELIEIISAKQKHLPAKDIELAVKQMLEIMSDALAGGERIEIRGFGSFSLHFRPPRQGRNPKTGEAVALAGKYVPHFKPGKDLRERVNAGQSHPIRDLGSCSSAGLSASTPHVGRDRARSARSGCAATTWPA
jgi:integration host factor subunit beta